MVNVSNGGSMAEYRVFQKLWRLFREESVDRTLVELPSSHIEDAAAESAPLLADRGYFRIWVTRMCLAHSTDWFSTRYPSVHAFVDFDFGGGDRLEIASLAGPSHLAEVDKAHLDQVMSLNHVVSPLTPFKGGTVTVELALLSVEADDKMGRFLEAMSGVASLVAVPQLSSVLSIAGQVADGARAFAGVEGNRMQIGYQNTFVGEDGHAGDASGNELRDHFIVVANTPAGDKYTSRRLWLTKSGLRVGDSRAVAKPLSGVDWMLIHIETRTMRDDYANLSDVTEPLHEAIRALIEGNTQQAEARLRVALSAALTSQDLISADRTAVARWARSEYDKAGQQLQDLALPPVETDQHAGSAASTQTTLGATDPADAAALLPAGPDASDVAERRPAWGAEVPQVDELM